MASLATELRRGQQKASGTYLTPKGAAAVLIDWAIRAPSDVVLDPAVGAGVFLLEAQHRLDTIGATDSSHRLFAVDIDDEALALTSASLPGIPRENLRNADFLTVKPTYLPQFDAIVGNPPWIRHHHLRGRAHTAALEVTFEDVRVPGRSGYWGYFLMHALRFLKPGGRLALLLPWAIVQADYGSELRRLLVQQFARTEIYLVEQRLFDGINERCAAILAEGFDNGPGTYVERRVRAMTDLADGPVVEAKSSLWNNTPTVRIGDVAEVAIGTVTGANAFFLLTPSHAAELGVPPERLLPCVSRRRHLRGMSLSTDDLRDLIAADEPALLLALSPDSPLGEPLAQYLEEGRAAGVAGRTKCRDRSPWYSVTPVRSPDAFVSYLGSRGPMIHLNRAGATCTNSFYAINWKALAISREGVAAGLVSTLGELSAETVGRVLGGGALKVEPSDVRRIEVPEIPISGLDRVEAALRQGNREIARDLVDASLVKSGRLSTQTLRAARDELAVLQSGRLTPAL